MILFKWYKSSDETPLVTQAVTSGTFIITMLTDMENGFSYNDLNGDGKFDPDTELPNQLPNRYRLSTKSLINKE